MSAYFSVCVCFTVILQNKRIVLPKSKDVEPLRSVFIHTVKVNVVQNNTRLYLEGKQKTKRGKKKQNKKTYRHFSIIFFYVPRKKEIHTELEQNGYVNNNRIFFFQ